MQEPILSILQPPTVTELLRKCETGSVKNVTRYNLQLFRKFIEKDEFYFKLTYNHAQRGRIYQRYDKLFVKSGRHVHNLRANEIKESTELYSIGQYSKSMRLTDDRVLAVKGPIFSSTLLPRSAYRPMLLILNDQNTLLHIDLETGQLIDSIYLGSLERCKFNYIGWERYMETIVVQSTDSLTKSNGKVLSYFIIMSIRPLKFVAGFHLETKLFEKQKSANISEGMLILSNPRPPDQFVNIYSLPDILHPDNFKWHTDIGEICMNEAKCDECTRSHHRIVGRDTHGFPLNLSLKNKPRLLMSILTSYPSIEFGGFPYHSIYSVPRQRDTFKVERIEDRVPITNGTLTFDNFMEEHNKVLYHDDPVDNRIIAIDAHKLTFYKIINNLLSKIGQLSPTPQAYLDDLHQKMNTSRKPNKNDNMDKSLFSYTYDVDTEIWFVLGVDLSKTHKRVKPVICLFDNFDGTLLKKFNLELKAEEEADYDLWADRDLLFINQHNPFGPNKAICYQLARKPDLNCN